ncbi:hypothetical protein BJP40_14745 [Streptomyces sp. CC53]|nr:hypothetical protein BJP40_14745 [Streptomyces sp. CC53]
MMPTGGATAPAQRASARTARPRTAPGPGHRSRTPRRVGAGAPLQDPVVRPGRPAGPSADRSGPCAPAPRACTGRCGTAPHRDSRLLEGPEGRPAPREAEAEKPGSKDVSITTGQR